jgi:hypothetical protein
VTHQAKILEDLEDPEIIQTSSKSNVAQELVEATLLTELCLDIEMKLVLPVIDILHHVVRVHQRAQNMCLAELVVPVSRTGIRVSAFLHSVYLTFGRASRQRCSRAKVERVFEPCRLGDTIDCGKLASTNLLHFIEPREKASIYINATVSSVHRCFQNTG